MCSLSFKLGFWCHLVVHVSLSLSVFCFRGVQGLSKPSTTRANVCVIGGGVGGLATAGRIAAANPDHRVVLLEKNDNVGGRMQSQTMRIDNINNANETQNSEIFRFDTGPSLLLLKEAYADTFAALGEKMENYVTLLPVNSTLYRVFFEEDCSHIDIKSDKSQDFREALEKIAPGSSVKYTEYLQIAEAFLNFGLPAVIEEKPLSSLPWHLLPAFLWACVRAFPLQSHASVLAKLFHGNKKLISLFSFQDLYVGLSPYEAPAVFSLLCALEFKRGIFYPQGGFGTIAQALETVVKKKRNVEIVKKATVKEFVFATKGGAGVDDNRGSDNTRIEYVNVGMDDDDDDAAANHAVEADVFICNIDVPQTEMQYLPLKSMQDSNTINSRPSCSVISLNFALDVELSQLAHHSIFISKHYDTSWRSVEYPDKAPFLPHAFNFYVHAPSRTDPTACPVGKDAITILVPVPPLSLSPQSTDSKQLIAKVRAAVIQRLENELQVQDLASHIVADIIRHPTTWKEDYNTFRGSVFGIVHSLNQLSVFRPRIKHPKVKNLFRVGASTRPGNGVPLVMIGSKLTAQRVQEEMSSRRKK